MNSTNAHITQRFEELPTHIQNALQNPSLAAAIKIIADKHRLPGDKASDLENEVALTLLAFERIDEFEKNIVRELLLSPQVATSITQDLNNVVFASVRDELENIYKAQDTNDVTENVETPIWKHEVANTINPAMDAVRVTPSIPVVPETHEPEVADEQPFYPRVPNYSKPMTNPTPRTPQAPRANDPYHEPIG